MKLPGFLNKSRWQSKDAAVRRMGVAEDDDPELDAALAGIARQDPDAGVRSAALKRLADPALTQRIALEDADAGVRAEARRLWFDLLAGTHARSPSPEECMRLLRAQDDAALIEHVSRAATDDGLRGAALARVSRTTLLAERAAGDPSPDLRLAALERIDDESMLERLAERTRKTDKRISRRARERADSLRIARGDGDAAESFARALCERMEKRVREPHGGDSEAEIERQWATVEARASDALAARFRAARALIARAREMPPVRVLPMPEPAAPEHPPTTKPAESPSNPEAADEAVSTPGDASSAPDAAPLLAQARFAASLGAANADREQEKAQRQAAMQRLEAAVAAFESAVEQGVVARAHAAHAELATLRKSHDAALSRMQQRRVADAERRYAELSRWQHWSDNQRRRQLCEAIEALGGSGLHPDAIATRVREAQAEWARLDAAEGHSSHSPHGWARRFHAACRHALEPAKSYFKKRQELRKTHAQAVASALEQAGAIPEDSSDWVLIAKTRHAIVEALRTLDRIDPHERKSLAKNLKAALSALDFRLASHHAEVENAKSALIVEAEALAAAPPARGSPAAARALQQRWREVGNGRRDRDQAQWKAFRGALDAVFGKLDAERSQRTADQASARSRAAELCAEMENLAKTTAKPSRAAVSRLESEWDALRLRDEALARRFRAAQSALRDADILHERSSRRRPYETWLARYDLCRTAESRAGSVESLRASWDALAHDEIASPELAARFDAATASSDPAPTPEPDIGALRETLIRIEIFAGLESPQQDLDRRRELQIERLSTRLRGGAPLTPHQELAQILTRWTALSRAAPAELDERLRRDLAAALDTLP